MLANVEVVYGTMTERERLVRTMLNATEEELYFDISSSVHGKPMFPTSRSKMIEKGRQWFEQKHADLATAICSQISLRNLARQDVPTHELVVSICGTLDLGVHTLGGAPVVTVAVLIVRLGLHKFCAAFWSDPPTSA
jgi:hypothetical protein